MIIFRQKNQFKAVYRVISLFLVFIFGVSPITPISNVSAQSSVTGLNLPAPGAMVQLSPVFQPAVIKGLKILPQDPFRFDFIIDTGDSQLEGDDFRGEADKLIKYFLTALTIPEEDLWVNLSPYEKNRIVPNQFGVTEMGRDLLAQDYLLKQITSSLIYPEDELGETFWNKIYSKSQELYGTSEIPMNTFNKVWIVPEKATIYENGDTVFVAQSHLKVLLEEDYVALDHNSLRQDIGTDQLSKDNVKEVNDVSSELIKEIILPEIEREVNEGKNFAQLRQIYNAVILATWFKENLKESVLGKIYVGQNHVGGVEAEDRDIKEKIYQQYLEAFKVGVFDFIKEDYDAQTQQIIPRKYFSGGAVLNPKATGAYVDEASSVHVEQRGILKTASTRINPLNEQGEIISKPSSSPMEGDEGMGSEQGESNKLTLQKGQEVAYLGKLFIIENIDEIEVYGQKIPRVIFTNGVSVSGKAINKISKTINFEEINRKTFSNKPKSEREKIINEYKKQIRDLLKEEDGVLDLDDFKVKYKLNGVDFYQISSNDIEKLIDEENRRRKIFEPVRFFLTMTSNGKEKFAMLNKLREYSGPISYFTFQKDFGLTDFEAIDFIFKKKIFIQEAERRKRLQTESSIYISEDIKSIVTTLIKKHIRNVNRENLTYYVDRLGVDTGIFTRQEYYQMTMEENGSRKESGKNFFTNSNFTATDIVVETLKTIEGQISRQILLEKAYLELQTLNRVQGGYQSLVIAELERRKRIKDLRPLEPIDFDIEIKGKERRTSSILDLLKKNEEQKNNLNKMEKSVDGLFEVIGKENIVYLSSRYGLDMKVILWGMIASDLEGEYDKEELEKIFDNRILNIVEGKIQERTKKSKVLSQKEETKSKIFVQLNQTDSLTQETILEIAKYIDQQLKRNDEKLTVDIALQEMTKKVATRFITRLEEQYFFRQYYAPSPEDFRRDDLLTEINRILSLEQGSITFDALSTILKKVEKANKTQQFLQSNGLNFKTHLNLYQQVAVQQMLEKRNALLADEMGLGKTLETIATFLASTEKEMLVLAPKKAVSRWLEDIVNHTDTEIEVVNLSSADIPNELKHNKKISFVEFNNLNKEERLKRKQYLYSQRPELPNGKKRVVIVNYDAMKIFERYRNANKLDVPTTDFIAMDEAHLLKNPKTNLYRVVFGDTNGQGAIQAKYKIVITGTPLENRISDLLSYLKYLARNDDSPEAQYINSISMEKFSRTFKVENLDKMAMLGGYLSEHMIRRLKDDVIKGLPIKKFVTVSLNPFEGTMILNGEEPISLPGSYDRQQALYDMVLKYPELFEKRYVKGNIKQVNEDTGFNEDDLSYSQTQVLRLEQVVSDPLLFDERIDNIKFDAVVRLIRERNVQGKSVLIFTDYKMMANHLKEYLKKELQNEVAYVDGDVEFSDRLKEVNKLQDKVVQNLVGTTGAIGTSIQATQAEAVIFLNFPWKSSTINQAIDRAHRIDKLRNYEGKELEIITLEYDVPVSIDRLKAMTVRIKEILTEMMINGNLTPEVLNAFYEVEKVSISEEIEKVYGDSHVAFDDYELSLMEQFQAKIVEILRETNPEVLKQLWDDISDIYLQILDNKSSYFANVASLDYLASDQFPELKRTKENPLKALDLASGPSTQYRAYHRQLEVFQEKGLYLDIYDYDRSQKMLDLGVVREGRQFIGAFENLDQIPESEFDIVNLSYAFRFASHPGKLIKNIHRILKKDGMFVLILPKNNKIPINFYTALEQAGFSIQKVNESKLKSSLYEETKYELQKEFGAELASDIIRQSNQQFTYLLVKKDNDIQGDLNDEDFRIEIQKAIVDSEKVEKLRKSKGRVKIVPRNARIKGTIETDVDGVEDKVSILKNRILTKIEKQLVSLTRFIRIYQEMAKDQKSYKRVKKIRLEIETQLDDLRIGIQEHIKLLKQEDVAILLESLINFKDNNFVRTWLNHNNKDFVVMLIKFIETEQQKIINLDSEIAEIDWAEPSSSPMEKESEPLGGIDLNPKNIDLDVQGTGIKYDLPEDVFEFDFPIHGFTPVIINIQPAPSLPVLLGEKKEEPTEHHQLSRI